MMKKITIRHLQGEKFLDVLFNFQMYAFRASPPFMEKEGWTSNVRQRKGVTYHVLFEDETPVAAAANTVMTQNIRGKLFPTGGVWGVVTLPVARRKGYSRQVIGSLLSAVKEAGAVFSNLYPFRESFYERMGYVTYRLPIIAHTSTQSLAPLLKMELGGEVELKLAGEAYETYRTFLADLRSRIHGMTVFDFGEPAIASQNGCLQVSNANDVDCELAIQGLTALVFGTHDPQDFPLRGWGNLEPETQAVMRTMFPPRIPFLHENFRLKRTRTGRGTGDNYEASQISFPAPINRIDRLQHSCIATKQQT